MTHPDRFGRPVRVGRFSEEVQEYNLITRTRRPALRPSSDTCAPIVRVQNLSHRYTKDWAVRDVSFDIPESGIVGLLGSNGAGKSTCMNIMCGVLFPTKGDVLIDGYSIRKQPLAAKARLGFLPQQAPLYPGLTVEEYLVYCAKLRGLPYGSREGAVQQAMDRCGIAHFSKRLIGALSGGYRQRCGLAQAILHRPALVVLDEPTNGLDPVQILAVRELIREIGREHTVLLSTHILPEVEALCDQIQMIERGHIVFEGSLDQFANVVEPRSLIATFERPPGAADLATIDGIDAAESINHCKRRISFANGADIAPALVETSVSRNWGLKELYFERASLEAVFARLADKQCA